ncbi:MAG: GNAT family N-acetyltransferase [Armatimonadetes bacterium]|nr:GNAT family N-acetyltransferase [Armatimonadota bacterium]
MLEQPSSVPKVSYARVNGLRQALVVRALRNSGYEYMTNHRNPISLLQQIRWYFTQYRHASRACSYRLYLFHNDQNLPVGYGALQLREERLCLTECVGTLHRGRGYGKAILAALIEIGRREERELVAEIWASNERSIRMHRRMGFVLSSTRQHAGQDLHTYFLNVSSMHE